MLATVWALLLVSKLLVSLTSDSFISGYPIERNSVHRAPHIHSFAPPVLLNTYSEPRLWTRTRDAETNKTVGFWFAFPWWLMMLASLLIGHVRILEKCLFRIFACFWSCLLLLSCKNSSYILDISLLDRCFDNNFSHSTVCHFTPFPYMHLEQCISL